MFIIHGNIKTMAEQDYADGYVQIADGKIVAVGDMKDCPAPDGEVLDVQGNLVMPGIIEAHCHMGITEEKKGMEGDDCNETVDPVTPQLRAIDAINPMDAAFNDALQAGITSAMIGPGSANVVGGQFVFVKTHGRCIDHMIVKAPAAMKVAFGENPKVNYSGQNKSPATRMAIAAMLREELTKAVAYQKKREKEEGEVDFRYECWLPVLRGEIPLKAHAHRADDILTAVRIA
ncbi:MAG: amidohydrolase, partial [Lachnospiraceae bacterium]|nr:amidohydrolase [Lachnospiraceae bacterium]